MNKNKLQELKNWLKKNNSDLAYLSSPATIAYFSGFSSEPHERVLALFVSATGDPFLFTPALEVAAVKETGWPYDVIGYLDSQDPWQLIVAEITQRYPYSMISLEKNALALDRFEKLQELLPKTDFSLDIAPAIQKLQLKKSSEEIEKLIAAGNWADVAFEVGFNAIKEGVSELELIAEIEYQLKKRGVSHMSFDPLVLIGTNAANPHGVSGQKQVQPNELVLFDLGVLWQGYCSDATRTAAYKEPTAFQQEIYSYVLEAQLSAQAAVKPGITAGELDQIARKVITEYGYGDYFNHRLGHGIGMTVHEYPSLITGNELIIEEGMCFSLEPGIYLPGKVGVRIEDCVYVTADGCVPLTNTTKELIILE